MGGAIFQGTLALGGNALPNITSLTFDDAGADVISRVVGDTFDTHYMGTRNVTVTANVELAAASSTTIATQYQNGTTGAVTLNLFGATSTYLTLTSTEGKVLNQNLTGAVNGIVAGTITIALNNVTKAAI
jgi:hypothetical protein